MNLHTIARDSIEYPIRAIQHERSLVREIQGFLNQFGFSIGTIDGIWGTVTQSQYRSFASEYGFRPDEISPEAARFMLDVQQSPRPPAPQPAPTPSKSPQPSPSQPSDDPDAQFAKALQFTLRWEGGYVNHPMDKGGPTNKGITQSTYDAYRIGNRWSPQPVQSITHEEVRDIYRTLYWNAARCNELKKPLAIAHFDTAVNFGVQGAVRFLQRALGVEADGIIGANTRRALERSKTSDIVNRYVQARIDHRYRRVTQDPTQRVFLQGWLNRDQDLMLYVTQITSAASPN
ncbi:MAG: glycosyl hydrolase 108 family protein [Elainellaceae cyanobacterium]